MKVHTNNFKNQLKTLGREIKVTIKYGNTTLEDEIYSVSYHYDGNILKSVMQQLDIESSVDIPIDTIISFKAGLKINNSHEMLDYGNFVVCQSEKQEDTGLYKLTCYDKMVYTMKPYEPLEVTYPITISNFLRALATKVGLPYGNIFPAYIGNMNLQIPYELYDGLGYTYRDVLDEIAQATGSTIIVKKTTPPLGTAVDLFTLIFPTNTNDTIDEEFLKDINVNFGETYGPINSIVLSRSGESDNVYLRDETSVAQNGLCEIKIVDNQIMNRNDRSDYLEDILRRLNGLIYAINDFNSIGILYHEILDKYNIQIGETTYQCLMLNDDINISTGLTESIYTEMPEQSETDYIKADKTDQRINKTYLIVDKQNQTIESVVETVSDQNNKISQITQSVDEINSKIQDIADITVERESYQASLSFENINASEPISVNIYPISESISRLYPRNNLYPSNTQYMTTRTLRFIRTYQENGETLTENIDYELPDDLLYYDSNNYDEFLLSYDTDTCQVRKKCKYNADGTVGLLTNEVTIDYPYPQIYLGDGDYEVQILNHNSGYIKVRLMAANIYTTQFATKAEVSSELNQTVFDITATVSATYETKQNAQTNYSQLQLTSDNISATVANNNTKANIIAKINDNTSQVQIDADNVDINANDVLNILSGNSINLTSKNISINSNNFNVDRNGNLTCSNATIRGKLNIYGSDSVTSYNSNGYVSNRVNNTGLHLYNNYGSQVGLVTAGYNNLDGTSYYTIALQNDYGGRLFVYPQGIYVVGTVHTTSLESEKKNIELYQESALKEILNSDIYKYNLKAEQDNNQKHIGLVIGDKYKTSKVVSDNSGVDLYSMIGVAWKAIQEQQEQIEQLKKEIKKLKGEK